MAVVNAFRQLLNTISHELSRDNLRSLVHICGPYVPESRREDIKCGLDLFECLIHNSVIGDDLKLASNLLVFMRQMRPRRKDIIRLVKEFIRENYDASFELDSNGESLHCDGLYQHYTVPGSASTTTLDLPSNYADSCMDYTWHCICCDCKCIPRRVPTCVFSIAATVFLILTIFVCLVWFAHIPSRLYSDLGDWGKPAVGGSITAILALFFLISFIYIIIRKLEEARNATSHGYDSINGGYGSSAEVPFSSTSCSGSSTGHGVRIKRYRKSRRHSTSSAPTGSVTDASGGGPRTVPKRTRVLPPVTSRQMSYPDHHDNAVLTEDGCITDYSGDNASRRSSLIASEDDVPITVPAQPSNKEDC